MSTTGATADPLAALGSLPGVSDSVESVRKAVDRVYGHRIMRRRSTAITSEAALRASRGSAALSGADWALEEVRRRSDFGADDEARTVGAALRLAAEAGQLLSVWRQSPCGCWRGCTWSPPRRQTTRWGGRGGPVKRCASR